MKKYAIILIAIGIMAFCSITSYASVSWTSLSPPANTHNYPYVLVFVKNSGNFVYYIYSSDKLEKLPSESWGGNYIGNHYVSGVSTPIALQYYGLDQANWQNWSSPTECPSGTNQPYENIVYSNYTVLNSNTNTVAYEPPPPANQTTGEIQISLQGQTSQNFIVNAKDKDTFKLQTLVNFPLWKADYTTQTHSWNWTWKIEGTDDNNISYQFAEKPTQSSGDGMIDDDIGYMQDTLIFTPYFKIGSLGDKTIKVTCTNEWGYSISDTITIRLVAESTGAVTGTIIPSNTTGNTGNGDTIADKPIRDTYDDGILGDLQYGFDSLFYYITMPFDWLGMAIDNLVTWLDDSMGWVTNISNFFGAFFSFLPKEVTSAIGVLVTVIILFSILRIFRR